MALSIHVIRDSLDGKAMGSARKDLAIELVQFYIFTEITKSKLSVMPEEFSETLNTVLDEMLSEYEVEEITDFSNEEF